MTNRLDLPRRYREQLETLLREHLPGVEVWAYGSRVNGRGHEASDLDLVLRGPALAPLDGGFYDLLEAIEKSNVPILIQAHDWAMLPKSFHREIERDYVVLQEGANPSTPFGWREVTLGELGQVDRGRSRHRPRNATELYGGPYPFVQTGDIKASGGRITTHTQTYSEAGLAQSRLWPAGTMVVTIAANIAETAILTYPACFPDSVVGFVADDTKCDVRFIEYTFRLLRNKLQHENVGTGSVQDNINLQTLARLRFLIPSLPEQRAIAHILGTLDDKIELNRRMNETLEEMARALFKSWFVDFEPVRAKMEGRWRLGESLPGLPAEHYDLFPDRLVDSELGEIPEGWKIKTLGQLFTEKNVRLGDEDVPEYSCTNFGLVPRSERFKKKLSVSNSTSRVIRKGDFVFGLSRRVLNFGLMRDDVGCVSPAYRTYSVDACAVIPDLLERIMRLRSEYFYLAVSASSREGQSISQDALYGLKISLPDVAIQQYLYGTVQKLSLRSNHLSLETTPLATLRDTLLPKLVSGEMRVGKE